MAYPNNETGASRETLEEIEALWRTISEITPGSGPMSATLRDFTSVQEDALVIDDTSDAFDRLVSLHQRTRALADMTHRFMTRPATTATLCGGVVLGVAALGYGISQGVIPAHPVHHDSLREAFTNSPIATTLVATIATGTAVGLVNELLDRGYARFAGLSDALHRIQDGAVPYASSLGDRLSDAERETYGEILRLGYRVAAEHDEVTQQRFLEKIHQTMTHIVSKLESTPQAGMIAETLNALKDSFEAHPSLAEPAHDHGPLDHYYTPFSAPGV